MNAYEPAPSGSTGWYKASFSDHGNACVEVRFEGEEVLIRDSKYRGNEALRPIIAVPAHAWVKFLTIATGDATDDGTTLGIPSIHPEINGYTTLRDAAETTLTYTREEWTAFLSGVRSGEFSRLHLLAR
ncbi:DUF397 domain-containing protein [Nocardia anaemiae]|uniref:DUF397 domain-containing protein n=1 Tax=Nocardia anaemiae TaxID=263910 RepID=UPI0007C76931|nr:DUF397 domain-containing protein [Nocardia anaemiae]